MLAFFMVVSLDMSYVFRENVTSQNIKRGPVFILGVRFHSWIGTEINGLKILIPKLFSKITSRWLKYV